MSSKGQIVIPAEMRTGINAGDKILIIQSKDKLIMKKANTMESNLNEDLEFAKKTNEALERIKNNENTKMEFNDFIKEMKKW